MAYNTPFIVAPELFRYWLVKDLGVGVSIGIPIYVYCAGHPVLAVI